jgi:hypothetical protein
MIAEADMASGKFARKTATMNATLSSPAGESHTDAAPKKQAAESRQSRPPAHPRAIRGRAGSFKVEFILPPKKSDKPAQKNTVVLTRRNFSRHRAERVQIGARACLHKCRTFALHESD